MAPLPVAFGRLGEKHYLSGLCQLSLPFMVASKVTTEPFTSVWGQTCHSVLTIMGPGMSLSPVGRVPSCPSPTHLRLCPVHTGQPDYVSAVSVSVIGSRPPEPGRPVLPPGCGREDTERWLTLLRCFSCSHRECIYCQKFRRPLCPPVVTEPGCTLSSTALLSWKALCFLFSATSTKSFRKAFSAPDRSQWVRRPSPIPNQTIGHFLHMIFKIMFAFKNNDYYMYSMEGNREIQETK